MSMTEADKTEAEKGYIWLDDVAGKYVFVERGGIGGQALPPLVMSVGVAGATVRVYLTLEQAAAISHALDAGVVDVLAEIGAEIGASANA